MQLVKAGLPASELEFDGQSVHVTDPVDTLYCPATHAVQMPPSGPVHPALQVHFSKAPLPVDELVFDGQTMHVEVSEAPTAVEYVPAPQLVQMAAPVAVEYVPAPQSVH